MNVTKTCLTVLVCSGCRYEVNFQEGIDCGGAYIKLLTDTEDLNLVGLHVVITHYSTYNVSVFTSMLQYNQ